MRPLAIALCLVSVPVALLFLAPVALKVTAAPLDPALENPVAPASTLSLTLLDADGRLLGRQGPVPGLSLSLTEMPSYLPAAFLAVEDRRFFQHDGIDLVGLARSAYANFQAGRVVAGGSTISQQTVKLLSDDRERTLGRKIRELMNTAALERHFSKQQILELYLNRIYLGDGAHGVDTAARTYFGVSARQVTLSQAALLAALTRAPSLYSPRRDLANARVRAGRVLDAMVETGAISRDAADEAKAQPAQLVPPKRDDHDYVLDAAAQEARQLLADNGIASGAFLVRTTIQSGLQQKAEALAQTMVRQQGPRLGFSQAALVLMNPDGAITAMVGGIDYRRSVFNRVTQARRQPGSAFKPFVYAAALERGLSPWDWRYDQPVNISGYQPINYHNASYGQLQLTDALARSVNTIAVNLAQEVGIGVVSSTARRLGITSTLHPYASLALGTDVVTPLELTAAYGAFLQGGRVKPYMVSRLENTFDGTVAWQHETRRDAAVIADSTRRDMTAMLYNVVQRGTGTAARLGEREAAGKTGTSQDYRDAWFVGFTADHVAGVWVGNDDNSPMRGVTGGLVPARLWRDLMLAAEAGTPARALERSEAPLEMPQPDGAYERALAQEAMLAVAEPSIRYADLRNEPPMEPAPYQPVNDIMPNGARHERQAAPIAAMTYQQYMDRISEPSGGEPPPAYRYDEAQPYPGPARR